MTEGHRAPGIPAVSSVPFHRQEKGHRFVCLGAFIFASFSLFQKAVLLTSPPVARGQSPPGEVHLGGVLSPCSVVTLSQPVSNTACLLSPPLRPARGPFCWERIGPGTLFCLSCHLSRVKDPAFPKVKNNKTKPRPDQTKPNQTPKNRQNCLLHSLSFSFRLWRSSSMGPM